MNPEAFHRLAAAYRRRWRISLCAVKPDGRPIWCAGRRCPVGPADVRARQLAISEALRWGEATVIPSPRGRLMWAAPLMHNARLLGGVSASVAESRVFPAGGGPPAIDLPAAGNFLRHLLEQENLTNAALLAAHRAAYRQERRRAEAIHEFKGGWHYNLRRLYLLEEPGLIAAMRKGDRGEAREILNRLLVGVLHHAGDRLDLVKSYFMELVVTMCRSAVEAGGEPQELLGTNYASIAELSSIDDEEQLSIWLHEMLERLMDAIARHRDRTPALLLSNALQFMHEHCTEDISRDDAAAAAHMAPTHFSRLFKREFGRSFRDVLNRLRVERAGQMLVGTDRSIGRIALDCGFHDQSYFTKIFRQYTGRTPKQYRREHARGPSE